MKLIHYRSIKIFIQLVTYIGTTLTTKESTNMELLHTYDSSTKTLIWFHYSTGYLIRNPREDNKLTKVISKLSTTTYPVNLAKFNTWIVDKRLSIRTNET